MQPPTVPPGQQPPYGSGQQPPHGGGQPPYAAGPPPQHTQQQFAQQQQQRKKWPIFAAVGAVLAVAATVLIIVLTSKDDTSAGGEKGAGTGGLTCAPGDMGIKVDPKTGDSITCDGSGNGSGGGGSSDGGDQGSGGGSGAQVSDAKPDFLAGEWLAKLKPGQYEATVALSDSEKLSGADLPSKMDWTITGTCADKAGCTLNLDLGNGQLVTLTHDSAKAAFTGSAPGFAQCPAGASTTTVQIYIYDVSSGGFVRGYATTTANSPCATVPMTQSFQIYPA